MEPAPHLIERFFQAHLSDEIPHFNWNNSLLIHLLYNEERIDYQSFHIESKRLVLRETPKPISSTPYGKALKGEAGLFLPVAQVPAKERLRIWDEQGVQELQILPFVLLSGPIGAVLVPKPEAPEKLNELFQEHLPLLGGLIRECLIEELFDAFLLDGKMETLSDEAFFERFAAVIAKWMAPCSYELQNLDTGDSVFRRSYCKELSKGKDWFKLHLNGGDSTYELSFELPSFQYPVSGQPDWIHEVGHFRFRKHKYQHLFSTIFNFLRNYRIKAIDLTTGPLEKLKAVEALLKEVKSDYFQTRATQAMQHADGDALPPFCFFHRKKNWRIRFDGMEVPIESSYAQGMESIRLMLERPGEHLEPLTLYELLGLGGFTKPGKNKKDDIRALPDKAEAVGLAEMGDFSTVNPIRDQTEIQVRLDNYQILLEAENSIEEDTSKEQLKYWQIRYSALKELIPYFPENQKYRNDWGRCRREIARLSVNEDENYVDPYSDLVKPNVNQQTIKKRKDSIRTGIRKFLSVLKQEYPEVADYFEKTIILINRKNFRPFSYQPDLFPDDDYGTITWQTEPPN